MSLSGLLPDTGKMGRARISSTHPMRTGIGRYSRLASRLQTIRG